MAGNLDDKYTRMSYSYKNAEERIKFLVATGNNFRSASALLHDHKAELNDDFIKKYSARILSGWIKALDKNNIKSPHDYANTKEIVRHLKALAQLTEDTDTLTKLKLFLEPKI